MRLEYHYFILIYDNIIENQKKKKKKKKIFNQFFNTNQNLINFNIILIINNYTDQY
jgi:hypothetical protein